MSNEIDLDLVLPNWYEKRFSPKNKLLRAYKRKSLLCSTNLRLHDLISKDTASFRYLNMEVDLLAVQRQNIKLAYGI